MHRFLFSQTALDKFGQPWKLNPGDGAFYGPKVFLFLYIYIYIYIYREREIVCVCVCVYVCMCVFVRVSECV